MIVVACWWHEEEEALGLWCYSAWSVKTLVSTQRIQMSLEGIIPLIS